MREEGGGLEPKMLNFPKPAAQKLVLGFCFKILVSSQSGTKLKDFQKDEREDKNSLMTQGEPGVGAFHLRSPRKYDLLVEPFAVSKWREH